MNYICSKFNEIQFEQNSKYPKNEIGLAQLFCDIYQDKICYVVERSQWFYYDDRRWCIDTGQLKVMEYCKEFATQLIDYSMDQNDKDLIRLVSKITDRKKREYIVKDARQ